MSTKFYTLKVNEINAETPDCVSIGFEIPEDLTNIFEFQPGQYITIKKKIGDEEVRRSYSICTAPSEKKLKIAVKKVENGIFSTYANEELAIDTKLEVLPPTGGFVLPDNLSHIDTIVCYCAGSGITPVIAILKELLYHHLDKKVILYYGNKNTESIIFREELEGLKNKFLDRLSIHYVLSREVLSSSLFYGRLDGEKVKKFEDVFGQNAQNTLYYLCGPAPMIFDIKAALIGLGVADNQIHFELFNTSGLDLPQEEKNNTHDAKQFSRVTIMLDGLEVAFDFDGQHPNILDAALANGADLPFACKGGVCSTCKAHCDSGKVHMQLNYALESDEVEAGYILTCQSKPTTDEVYINFDR